MNFFMKTIKGNWKLEAEQEDEREQGKNVIDLLTGDWIDWIENRSAKENKVTVGTASTSNMMRIAHDKPCDSHEAGSSRTIFQSTREPRETSNLRNIIRNFEKGYLSPSKKDREIDECKQKNLVKKLVEAFEVKYKIYNDSKTAQESPEIPKENKSNASMLESWTKRSKRFRNPFKNDFPRSNQNSTKADELDASALSPEDRILHTWGNDRFMRRRLRELENSNSSVKSKMILTAFGREASGLELCSTFLPPTSDSSRPPNSFTRAELMRKIHLSNLAKRSDKTKTRNSVDLYMNSSEETSFTSDNSLPTTSTMIESPRSDTSTLPDTSRLDTSPKVIGAFLKKPIDVENTAVDWIPVTGKRLPRKRSLKKLLCTFTRRKLVKRFSSERNLCEEPREFQDSDYDERSCSSMSITSLVSVADVLRQQETDYFESKEGIELKTFKSNRGKGEASCDTYRSAENRKGRKLVLTEVPREDVKLDLGPSYPPPSQTIRFPSPLVDKLVPKLPVHPCVSKTPESPFVTSTKIDNSAEFNSSYRVYYNSNASLSTIIKNDLYEVEFRRSCSDLPSSSVTNHYDVPRRFLSRSENEILWMWRSKSELNRKEEPIYDIPKSQSIERPRSSIYDDALSLKRNSIYEEAKPILDTRSLARRDSESHHVIAKPIDTRIYVNVQV